MLADRSFDISDSVAYCGATLKLPAFTRGEDQLSAVDIERTRKIANVTIHVERVIGLIRRKYTILQSTLPIDLIIAKGGDSRAPVDSGVASLKYLVLLRALMARESQGCLGAPSPEKIFEATSPQMPLQTFCNIALTSSFNTKNG